MVMQDEIYCTIAICFPATTPPTCVAGWSGPVEARWPTPRTASGCVRQSCPSFTSIRSIIPSTYR